ncbi:hypothetical protein GH714_041163 [Hevea brasiliensis]|nr:hypothetical protein GH714_041163 [Hevea brasiliensis]
MDYDLGRMCRHAVDRSSGGLVDVNIEYFGTDDLLQYIADRNPHIECNEEALAIAEHMPHLRYLQIFGNKLTNEGLQAILDGCPHLESLDLRQCFNVNMDGHLGKRCIERIKDLRHPYDPTDDYPFDAEIADVGSSEEDYPSGFSEIDFLSDDDDYYEFSGGSDMSDFEHLYFD